jgi:hypothetical protein
VCIGVVIVGNTIVGKRKPFSSFLINFFSLLLVILQFFFVYLLLIITFF